MKITNRILTAGLMWSVFAGFACAQPIPLPEHPRPDFFRETWQNLNGLWAFEFDSLDAGRVQGWPSGKKPFTKIIQVPFPWGSTLSGVGDEADIAWYRRDIVIPPEWKGRRIFLVIGASDWDTEAWLDGRPLGSHQGGYTPFAFECTRLVRFGKSQKLVIRADDTRREFALFGKQGYGNARGIWQTVYLEARGPEYIEAVHFRPDIETGKITADIRLDAPSGRDLPLTFTVETESGPLHREIRIPKGRRTVRTELQIPDRRLWTLDDPYLYQATVCLNQDTVQSYFGMRKISVVNLPGTDFPYVALNDRPVYLQLALDQSYHPDGYYTFPSDSFMRDEILRSKSIGLNGIRPHIKVEIPRKLYWADRLGLLVMQDLPNSWGEPDAEARAESENTLRAMIDRDFNHPAIFSWICFNETWGLSTRVDKGGQAQNVYLPETQYWAASMMYLAKSLDPTRLVEDNSICCGIGHTETDLNSFHVYLPGWEWEDFLKNISDHSFPGSTHLFEDGFTQGGQPTINSECGNVWGYDGSTGDVDWSWDYHRMMNTFRKYPKIGGWLYTEHHDVINEWNGYWRFDRSEKFTGVDALAPGMRVNDFHAPVYLSTGNTICRTVRGGEQVTVPLHLSSMTGEDYGDSVRIHYRLTLTNTLGETVPVDSGVRTAAYRPYIQSVPEPLTLTMPDMAGLAILTLTTELRQGQVLHHNFMHFEVLSDVKPPDVEIVSQPPAAFAGQEWHLKQWDVLEGLKVNGAGEGYFEYTFVLPENLRPGLMKEAYFLAECSAKQLFTKDRDAAFKGDVDYMLGGLVESSSNPNAYPMTDEISFPSDIVVLLNGQPADTLTLPDDPADHRGVLSWHHQLQDRKLREAGSYGYLVKVPVSPEILAASLQAGKLSVRLQTLGEGGLAIYGRAFGRYPVDPALIFRY